MKLKTLNESYFGISAWLQNNSYESYPSGETVVVKVNEQDAENELTASIRASLRAEAIKWINELKENEWNQDYRSFSDDETGTYHVRLWIMHFFNITDEELSKRD